MKIVFALGAVFLAIAGANPAQNQQDLGLPELYVIKTATLTPSYSCRSYEDFQKGYEQTSLFLSKYARTRNTPELIFNGACDSEDNLETAVTMGLIADLGEIPLQTVTAHLAFNPKNIASFDLYSKFARHVKIRVNHTYAAFIGDGEIRTLFVFSVTGYVPNKELDLSYAVKEYQILRVDAESRGFDWATPNQ